MVGSDRDRFRYEAENLQYPTQAEIVQWTEHFVSDLLGARSVKARPYLYSETFRLGLLMLQYVDPSISI